MLFYCEQQEKKSTGSLDCWWVFCFSSDLCLPSVFSELHFFIWGECECPDFSRVEGKVSSSKALVLPFILQKLLSVKNIPPSFVEALSSSRQDKVQSKHSPNMPSFTLGLPIFFVVVVPIGSESQMRADKGLLSSPILIEAVASSRRW